MTTALVGILLMAAGVAGVALAARKSHAQQQLEFIRGLGHEAGVEVEEVEVPAHLQNPLARASGTSARVPPDSSGPPYPAANIDRVHSELLKAGLTGTIRAEEFVAFQVACGLMGLAIGFTTLATHFGGTKLGVFLLLLLPILGGRASPVAQAPGLGPSRCRDQRPARRPGPHDDLRGGRPGSSRPCRSRAPTSSHRSAMSRR